MKNINFDTWVIDLRDRLKKDHLGLETGRQSPPLWGHYERFGPRAFCTQYQVLVVLLLLLSVQVGPPTTLLPVDHTILCSRLEGSGARGCGFPRRIFLALSRSRKIGVKFCGSYRLEMQNGGKKTLQ